MFPEFFPLNLKDIVVSPTISATAYADGQIIGGVQSISGASVLGNTAKGGPTRLRKVVVTDAAGASARIALLFFNATITAAADQTAFNPSAADVAKFLARVDVNPDDYIPLATYSLAAVTPNNGLGVTWKSATSNINLAIIAEGTPTYGSTTALKITLTFDNQ